MSPAVTPAASPVASGSDAAGLNDSLSSIPSFSDHKRKLTEQTTAAPAAAASTAASALGVGVVGQQKKKQQKTLMGFFPRAGRLGSAQ